MLCRDDEFQTPRIRHFEDNTLCDYITAYRNLAGSELVSYLPNVQWEKKAFDVTVGVDMLDYEREFARLVNPSVSPVSVVIWKSLGFLFRESQRSREAEDFLREVLTSEEATRIALLATHGETVYGKWYCIEGGISGTPVQDWINEQIEKAKKPDVLLIGCCNPGNFKPRSKGIPVLYATGIVGVQHEYTYHLVR